MESSPIYNLPNDTLAWKLVIFGNTSYSGFDDPKSAINIARTCKLFDAMALADDVKGYWQNHLLNLIEYKKADQLSAKVAWKKLFCNHSNELNKIANYCLKIIDKKSSSTNQNIVIFELLKPFINGLSNPYSNKKAQYCLGKYYYDSNVSNSLSEAFKYFKLSANQGFASAQNHVALYYHRGWIVQKDNVKALEYYELSAAQKNAEALCTVGDYYFDGVQVEKDVIKAFEYYNLSAHQKNHKAEYQLALHFYDHKGMMPNSLDARKYYKLSARGGYAPAQEKLTKLKKTKK